MPPRACVAYGFLPTPPSAATLGRVDRAGIGVPLVDGTTPGSTSCRPSKNLRTCSSVTWYGMAPLALCCASASFCAGWTDGYRLDTHSLPAGAPGVRQP